MPGGKPYPDTHGWPIWQHRCGRSVPSPGNLALVPVAPAAQPAHAPELGAHDPHHQPIAAVRPPNASLAPRALRRPHPREEPSALSSARWDLRGGPPATAVPTAIYRKAGTVRLHTLERQSTQAHCLHLVANAIVYWNTIYIQRALDELDYEPARDELAGLTPTLFEHVNPLGTYDFSSDRQAGQLRPLRTAAACSSTNEVRRFRPVDRPWVQSGSRPLGHPEEGC
jgi:hypothetical protein